MPVSSVEGLTSAAPTAVLNSIHAWDARSSPKATDSAPVPSTLSRHSGSGSGSSAPRPSRSPIHRTHQPYRDLPLSIFGVESELQSFAGVNTDKVVAVKPAYKAGLPHVRPASSLSLRPSQRSPITALDAGDSLTAAPAVPCGGGGGGGGGGAMGSAAGPVPGLSIAAGHSRPVRAGMNKRIVSLDQMERYGAGSGTVNECGNVSDMYRCSVALRLVEAEEKHLNYTGVELPAAELNLSDTAERARRLQQRRRQMQYGKETTGYANYISAVPNRWDREFRNPMHPMTPRPEYDCSKRTFDRYLNIWRRQLHLWDDYDRNNPSVQHVRIGIPTLRRLGLEVPPGTPDPYANGLRAFTPPNVAKSNSCGGNGGIASCTPVSYRFQWRDPSMSSSSYQRQQQQQGPYSAGVGSAGGQAAMAHHMRPSSGCGGASWSITNTPHTPYHGGNISCHGSTHSNNSYPTLLSVLAQPTIYSPHWADSSQHSSPTPNNTKCSGVYYHSGGMPANGSGGAGAAMSGMNNNNNNANIAPVSIGNGGGSTEPGGGGGGGNAAYWEGNSYYNNSGYGYRTHGSPYGGRRYTPQSTPSHHYQHHYYAATAGASGAGGGYGAGGGMACAAAHGQEQ